MISTTGNSRPVQSAQSKVHESLQAIVQRHRDKPWRAPLHQPTEAVFRQVLQQFGDEINQRPLVLDSGCGTGDSARLLAERYPQHLVLAVDRSEKRLTVACQQDLPLLENNILWIRADLPSFWRLSRRAGWRLAKHFIWYPNPYPKRAHTRRRWHAHPVFPDILGLGGQLELRTNWQVYAEEFAAAIGYSGCTAPAVETLGDGEPVSGFERKYRLSRHKLFRVQTTLP